MSWTNSVFVGGPRPLRHEMRWLFLWQQWGSASKSSHLLLAPHPSRRQGSLPPQSRQIPWLVVSFAMTVTNWRSKPIIYAEDRKLLINKTSTRNSLATKRVARSKQYEKVVLAGLSSSLLLQSKCENMQNEVSSPCTT